MLRLHSALAILLGITASSPLWADFSYQQTSQLTGGTLLHTVQSLGRFSAQARKIGDPTVSTYYLKGNRLAVVRPDSIEITDLDQEAFIRIDLLHRTWYKLTFAELRARIERIRQKTTVSKPETAADVSLDFNVKVRNTGAHQEIDGMMTSESIVALMLNATGKNAQPSGNLSMTTDLWLTPAISGYNELREFHRRFAVKAVGVLDPSMDLAKQFLQNPGSSEAALRMAQEVQKIHGVPVLQIMRMGSTPDGSPLPAASEAPLPAEHEAKGPSASDAAKQGAAAALTSRLPFGGVGHKKNTDTPASTPAPASDSNQGPAFSVLMEMKIGSSNFSTAPVDPSHFIIPEGFKEVPTPSEHN